MAEGFGFHWTTEKVEGGYDITSYLNEVVQHVIRVEENLVTATVIRILRDRGYLVIGPETPGVGDALFETLKAATEK